MPASARSICRARRRCPASLYVLTGAELAQILPPVPDTQLSLPRKWTTQVQHTFLNPQQPLLAHDKVRHVGEAVAVILAESRYHRRGRSRTGHRRSRAVAGAWSIPRRRCSPARRAARQHGTNLIGEFRVAKGNVEAALAKAPHRIKRRFHHHRYAAMPMECRGVISAYDQRSNSITIWSSCQVVHWLRREASTVLNLPEARIRCVALDVGGGFGVKGHVYPEELLIPFLARRWSGRCAGSRTGTSISCRRAIRAIRSTMSRRALTTRAGCWRSATASSPIAAHGIRSARASPTTPRCICPGRTSSTTSRSTPGLPRPTRCRTRLIAAPAGRKRRFAMERTIDLIAAELGLDPADVRLRNMIPGAEMPYRLGIPYRDGETDRLRQRRLSEGAAKGARRDRRRRRRSASASARPAREGRYLGLGIGCYVEGTGVGPFEGATVRIDPTGKVYVSSGACPQGQGMETIFSQIVADAWKVKPDDVVMALADTSAISIGFGTIASRSTVTLSAAIHHASESLREKAFAIAANMLECAPGDLELRNGTVGVVGRARATRSRSRASPRPRGPAGITAGRPASGRARGDLLLGAADRHLVLCRRTRRSSRSISGPAG